MGVIIEELELIIFSTETILSGCIIYYKSFHIIVKQCVNLLQFHTQPYVRRKLINNTVCVSGLNVIKIKLMSTGVLIHFKY